MFEEHLSQEMLTDHWHDHGSTDVEDTMSCSSHSSASDSDIDEIFNDLRIDSPEPDLSSEDELDESASVDDDVQQLADINLDPLFIT